MSSPCKNGCGQAVMWDKKDHDEVGKWRPFNADGPDKGMVHDCPNYKKGEKKQQPQPSNDENEMEIKVLLRQVAELKSSVDENTRKLNAIEALIAAR